MSGITHNTGDMREDGYVLVEFRKENGRLYPMWRSPLSIRRRREYQRRYYQMRKKAKA